jgi:exodeoxyribonuclease-3
MALRIATWNVNSIRPRLEQVARFLRDARPDVICLQEIKVQDADFPFAALRDLGYPHILVHGQKAYHGVAIAARAAFETQGTRQWCGKDDRRHAFVRLDGGVELHNFYVPSGGDLPDPEQNDKFDHKLRFLKEMARWCRRDQVKTRPVVLVGDLNVAPLDCDVWNHKRLIRSVGHTPVESDHLKRLLKAGGFVDVARHFAPPPAPVYTWWGYRYPQSFAKNYGWRLDHIWVTPPLIPRLVRLDIARQTRTWERPSDHVPVVLDLA